MLYVIHSVTDLMWVKVIAVGITQMSNNWYFALPLRLLTVSLNVKQYEPAKQISHKILDWVNFFLNVMSHKEH